MLIPRLITPIFLAYVARASVEVEPEPTVHLTTSDLLRMPRSLLLFTSSSTAFDGSVLEHAVKNTSTVFVRVDCDQEEQLCSEQDVNSYPTIRLLESEDEKKSRTTRYRGPRTESAIRGFLKRQELPILTKIEPDKVEEFNAIDDLVVVAYLPVNDKQALDAFTSVAQNHHLDYVFGYTTDASLASSEDVPIPSIKIFKNVDSDHRIASGLFTVASLEDFLEKAVPSVVRDFKEKDLEVFMQRDKLTLYVFTSTEEDSRAMRRSLTPLAKKYEKYVVFAMASTRKHEEMATNFLARFARSEEVEMMKMGVVVHAPLNDNVFLYELGKKIEVGTVEGMLKTILQGKAKSGDIFGKEAEDLDDEKIAERGLEHDEL